MIILLSIVFSIVNAIVIDPINQTCIANSVFTIAYSEKCQTQLHYFILPPFS